MAKCTKFQRPLYRHYYQETQALIYVVDSNDKERMDQAKEELHRTVEELHGTLGEDEVRVLLLTL